MKCLNEDKIICEDCGKLRVQFDMLIPFGCSDYESPEPLEPQFFCKRCSKKLEKHWFLILKNKNYWSIGDWQKSKAERKVAKKLNLVWVGSSGVGVLGSKNFLEGYRYYSKKRYDKMSKLPYFGYCPICGKEKKNDYCSDRKCEKSFENKE